MLRAGLNLWGGPASMTDELARAIWFADSEEFYSQRDRLVAKIMQGEPLSPRDWHRALAALEFGFISWVLGAAGNWSSVTGLADQPTLEYIRAIQLKLALVRPWPEPYARPGHARASDDD
jgi:hypothetical protein